MAFDWVAIALSDVVWISIAFLLGFLARSAGLPPLVGFLAAGFVLHAYGIGSSEMLEKLSEIVGGVVAGSRCAVDEGWIKHDRQVGQTGKTVHSKLYIACGISGAIQHLVGMQDCEFIIAINKDKTAPIFDVAHLGIVGDCMDVIPSLIAQLEQAGAKPKE